MTVQLFRSLNWLELIEGSCFRTIDGRLEQVEELGDIVRDAVGRHTCATAELLTPVQVIVGPAYDAAGSGDELRVEARSMLGEMVDAGAGSLPSRAVCAYYFPVVASALFCPPSHLNRNDEGVFTYSSIQNIYQFPHIARVVICNSGASGQCFSGIQHDQC